MALMYTLPISDVRVYIGNYKRAPSRIQMSIRVLAMTSVSIFDKIKNPNGNQNCLNPPAVSTRVLFFLILLPTVFSGHNSSSVQTSLCQQFGMYIPVPAGNTTLLRNWATQAGNTILDTSRETKGKREMSLTIKLQKHLYLFIHLFIFR